MEKLSQTLWRERELLDNLLFKLEAEQLVLAGGRDRWVVTAAREVEDVLETIRQTEILRSVAADEAAAALDLDPNPSLRMLAAASDEPWRTILLEHHEAFLVATREIAALADANRELVAVGYGSPRGTRRSVATFDEVAAGATVAATARVTQQSLLDFLR